jgi:hypothetical protein
MAQAYTGQERREFLRHRHEKPIHYKILNVTGGAKGTLQFSDAISRNLSASGILFSSSEMPKISSLLMLELDYRSVQICREIEENAFILDNRLFGKVVRIEDNGSGAYDIGVAFVKKFDNLSEVIKDFVVRP